MTREQLVELEACIREIDLAAGEADQVSSPEEWIAQLRAIPDHYVLTAVRVAEASGRTLGVALCTAMSISSNQNLLEVRGGVHPDHRRRGVGRQLLAAVSDVARAQSRQTIVFKTRGDSIASEAWARAVGAEPAQREQSNRLDLDRVDRTLLEQWVRQGPERAPDYELLTFEGACPEQLLPALCDLYAVMSDAPRDDLDRGDVHITPDQMRQEQASAVAGGVRLWTTVVRHRPTGELVGLHDAHQTPAQPSRVFVGNTGVKANHRGHALGKWMKAAMTLRILDKQPEVREIGTLNASSNAAMLGINDEMGYQVKDVVTTWQLPLDPSTAV